MFDAFRKALTVAVLLIILGVLMIILQLFRQLVFSWIGLIALLAGTGLVYVIQTSKEELFRLHLQNVDLRKQLEAHVKKVSYSAQAGRDLQ